MKVTKEQMIKRITDVRYIRIPDTTVTICHITLENGFSVRGESACVDPKIFDEQKGNDYAYEKAVDKLWELEGYLLAEKLWQAEIGPVHGDAFPFSGYFSFGRALDHLRKGLKVARKGWNGKSMWLRMQVPDSESKMTLPYIYMKTADQHLVPWLASQTDVLCEDWMVVD